VLNLRDGGVDVGGEALLRGVELELPGGALATLQGPSGAGKSSLLRVLCGLDELAAGRLELRGESPDTIGWPAFRRRVVLVAQRPLMLAGSVRDNLALAFDFQAATGAFDEAAAAEMLGRLKLPGVLDRRAEDLSVGEQQRVSLVRGALLRPEVLLLDEPTSALDEDAVGVVEAWVRELVQDGAAVVLVSHDRAQQERLADTRHDVAAWRVEPRHG